MEWSLAIVALALLGVAAVSRRLLGSPITPAMVFVAVGLLVGPKVLDGIDLESTSGAVRTLAEATLALVLFCDASRIDLRHLRREVGLPLRLLGIGLPLTIALGAVAAAATFGALTIGEAVILAVVLAPTDAALGQAVVTEPRIPARIRQGLNVESGLNDGICVPLLFAAVAVADVESEISEGRSAATLLLEEIGYGIVGGVIGGLAAAMIVIHAGRRGLIDGAWRQVIPGAGAALAYGTASALDGSGFIAAFVAGMTFRLALKRDPGGINGFSEEVADVLNGVTFLLFGAVLLGPALGEISWNLVALRRAQPDGRAHAAGRHRDARLARQGTDARLPRLVRPPRTRLDRVRGDRDRGIQPPPRAPDRPHDLPDGGPLGPRPRAHRRSPRRPLRALVRATPARRGAADGECPSRGDARPRTGRASGSEDEGRQQGARPAAACDPSRRLAPLGRAATHYTVLLTAREASQLESAAAQRFADSSSESGSARACPGQSGR